jgi:hypothetical protein
VARLSNDLAFFIYMLHRFSSQKGRGSWSTFGQQITENTPLFTTLSFFLLSALYLS